MQDTKITNVEPHILTLSVSGFGFSAVSLVLHCHVQGLCVALEELLCLGHFTLQYVGLFFRTLPWICSGPLATASSSPVTGCTSHATGCSTGATQLHGPGPVQPYGSSAVSVPVSLRASSELGLRCTRRFTAPVHCSTLHYAAPALGASRPAPGLSTSKHRRSPSARLRVGTAPCIPRTWQCSTTALYSSSGTGDRRGYPAAYHHGVKRSGSLRDW